MPEELAKTGLQSSIWNNNLKSLFLLGAYPFILTGVVFAIIAAYGYFTQDAIDYQGDGIGVTWAAAARYSWFTTSGYWPMIVTAVIIWFMIAYVFQGVMMRAMSKSHPVTRKEEPDFYNLVENLCISQGMTMPRLEIIETHARNAFASGINNDTYSITVTRGLMQALAKDELEAVLGHELSHIIHRDVRLMMVCVIFTGILGVSAQLLWSNIRYSLYFPRGNNRSNGGGIMLLFVIGAILWIGYAASMLARFAISRKREFMADAGSVQITKNPDAMMRALLRIAGADDIPAMPDDVRAMCFENRHAFLGLFATHPPIADRIRAISDYSGLPIPDVRPRQSAGAQDALPRSAQPGTRDNWITRQRFPARRNPNPWG